MNNAITGNLLRVLIEEISPRRDIDISPWIVIVFLILVVLLVVVINLLLDYRLIKKKLKKEVNSKADLTEKCKDLEKILHDNLNERTQLKNRNDQLLENNDKLTKLAYYDNLTNLPNSLSLKELLDSVMLTLREGEIVGILLINLDNFKQINSQLGSSYGDELLIDATHRIKQVIDENDYLARVGGDEFVILTQNITDTDKYDEKLKRILNVFSYPFTLSTEERFVTVSIGVAIAPKDSTSSNTMLKNVNVAMRNAKARGKNGYSYFEESMNEAITNRIQMQSELRDGFENNEFHIYYEPIVSLTDNTIKGFDVLKYWDHPSMGLLHPSEYMMNIDDTGIIIPIGIWAFKDVCRQLAKLQEHGHDDIKLYYAVSKLEFKEPEFTSIIWDIVGKSDINPNNIVIEITESTATDNIKQTISTISKLGELGIRFCIDKFGSDYSSIKYLHQLPIDQIKIDKSLSRIADKSQDQQKTLEATIDLIKTFNLNVNVEGIDNQDQADFFKNADCSLANGSLYSQPIQEDQVLDLLEKGL